MGAKKKAAANRSVSMREKKPKEKLVLPEEKGPMHVRMDKSFLEYASYVIRDRAIPNVADGLKPVQRRILWALKEKDDGKFIKVANVVGHTMQYHPHGDASIGDALVNLANKRYLIEGQGNFGNIYTGDPAAASRYIECRLTELARNEIFNDEITEFVPSYDGRNKEPVTLPSKLPLLLMLGTEGIAVGMSSKILPHNFCELIEAQISILKKESFKVVPDFPTGGLMDSRDYKDGRGSIRVRAKIKVKDKSTVVITELPPATTSESLIGSIEDASRKGKLKVKGIDDFTAEKVEIQITTPTGVNAEKLVDALYAFTNCEATISSRITVIRDNRPAEMTVSEVLHANTERLVAILKAELELRLKKLEQELHFKTLVQLFVENRIYKSIEECKSNEAIYEAIYAGFKPHRKKMYRDLIDEDVEMLLGVRIRRISLFDINKHKEEIRKVLADIEETKKNLKGLTRYVINHLKGLLEKYGKQYPRKTKRARFDEVDAREVAFKGFKVAYDRAKGYIGYKVTGAEFQIACTQFDKLLMVSKDGHYKVMQIEEKFFVGEKLYFCDHPDRDSVFTMVYQTREACFVKRFTFGGTIMNKEYSLIPGKGRIVYFAKGTPEKLFIRYKPVPRQKVNQSTCKPKELLVKGAKARGKQLAPKIISNIGSKPTKNWEEDAATTEVVLV
ncbi:MAG: DNA topoisomerase IV subunit A [Limisphaerales bacterium]